MKVPQLPETSQCEVKGWKLGNPVSENLRPPRIVRVGLIQNSIVLPTTLPINEQRDAIHKKIIGYLEHAAACKANIVCLQEAWSKSKKNKKLIKNI